AQRRFLGGTVIDDDRLEIAEGLRGEAVAQVIEETSAVVARYDDADGWLVHVASGIGSSRPCYRTPGDSRPRGRPAAVRGTEAPPDQRMTASSLFILEHDFFRKPVPTPHRARGRLFRDHALTDADTCRRNEYPHLAPEKFKQDRDATIVGDAFEDSLGVGENA